MRETTEIYVDERGYLHELYYDKFLRHEFGYIVMTHPGFGRDTERWHYHMEKSEMFTCVAGSINVAVRDRHGVVVVHNLTAGDGVFVRIEGEDHSVFNGSNEDATILAMCDKPYNPADELRRDMDDWSWRAWSRLKNKIQS